MKNPFKKRIRNLNPKLSFYVKEGDTFHVGLLFEDYLLSPNLDKYKLPKNFVDSKEVFPLAKGSVTRVNTKGKFVRKLPEEKTTIRKHISFIRKRDGARISYNRNYHVYTKVMLHKFEMNLIFAINDHNQKVVICEPLVYENSQENIYKNTHAANIFNELFGDFEIFDSELNPAIHFNTKFEEIILPKGSLTDKSTFDEILDIGTRFSKNESVNKAFQKRIEVLKNFEPEIRGKGPNGFYGYLVFGFKDLGIIFLETMYAGHATYVFSADTYKADSIKDKQTVLSEKLHLRRFFHNDDWERKITSYMNELRKNSK